MKPESLKSDKEHNKPTSTDNKLCTSAEAMSAIYNESEAWIKIDWVKVKLEKRWETIKNSNGAPFEL
jgi:hypothetical protein